jgi:GGDEF domain-containing protein
MRRSLANKEFIFRFGETSVVAILPGLEPGTAAQITSQLERTISLSEKEPNTGFETVRVGVACAPHDGSTFEVLLRAARERSRSTAADSSITHPRQVH